MNGWLDASWHFHDDEIGMHQSSAGILFTARSRGLAQGERKCVIVR